MSKGLRQARAGWHLAGCPGTQGAPPSWQRIAAGCRQSHAMVGGPQIPIALGEAPQGALWGAPITSTPLEGDTEGTVPAPRPVPWGQGTAPGPKPTSRSLWELPHAGHSPGPVCTRGWLFLKDPAHTTGIWTAGPIPAWRAAGMPLPEQSMSCSGPEIHLAFSSGAPVRGWGWDGACLGAAPSPKKRGESRAR